MNVEIESTSCSNIEPHQHKQQMQKPRITMSCEISWAWIHIKYMSHINWKISLSFLLDIFFCNQTNKQANKKSTYLRVSQYESAFLQTDFFLDQTSVQLNPLLSAAVESQTEVDLFSGVGTPDCPALLVPLFQDQAVHLQPCFPGCCTPTSHCCCT